MGKIWLPKVRNGEYQILVDGVDRTTLVISAQFTRGIIGVECTCKITMLDPNGTFAALYKGGETIEYKTTYEGNTVSEWKGKLERPIKQFGQTYLIELQGSHFQSDTLDITVNADFAGTKTSDEILKELVNTYLPGFTTTNVTTSTVKPVIRWNNKPLHDCILDLCNLSEFDAYVDSDKDIHFFARESIENTVEAIVWNQTLVEIVDFGADSIDIRNRIIVYGEGLTGLPIIYRTDDIDSQNANGIKEKVVKDSSIRTYAQAKQLGDATLESEKAKTSSGTLNCLLLINIKPGEMIWVVNPVQGIEDTFRMIKFVFRPINYQTEVIISKDKTIPLLFQERKKAELASENLDNPHNMTKSFNFDFDNVSEFDSALSSGITIFESNLKIEGAATGTMVSSLRTTSSTVSQVFLKVTGDFLSGTQYAVSLDNGTNWEIVNLEELKTMVNSGNQLRLRITLNSTSTLISSAALLYKS